MGSRKCIYTGKDANCTDKVIPHDGGDIDHNWANSVPCSKEYKNKKGLNMPSENELELNRAFKQLELAKMDVLFWERKIKLLQEILSPKEEKSPKESKTAKKKKEKEIKIAHKEKEIKEVDLDSVLEKKKKKVIW